MVPLVPLVIKCPAVVSKRFRDWFVTFPVRRKSSFVVPVAFATTFPAEALLGVGDARLLPVGFALAAATLYASHRFWLVAVRRYASAEG